ncbi:hypothetical protein X801_02967 [Opisthorchis viverrini]|uniref:Peptidase A2 domain-containing protein n=1 Tax=Opisthorchis viverrini TaxID=6198 RepID=A0A1S8X372_OPIVI|nr:hypothetical protein X801_02967 [Opisthorchis viverrini]
MGQEDEFEPPVVLHAQKTSNSPISPDRTVPALRPPNVFCSGDDFTIWSFRARSSKQYHFPSTDIRGSVSESNYPVSHPGLKAELIRRSADNIRDAIQLARSYEATSELGPQLHASKITTDPGPRQLPPGNRNNLPGSRMNCPYCRRFGRKAQRCGHNPPVRPTGESLSFCNSVPIISHISHSTPPLTISGYLDKRPVRFLVDTGASCSVVGSRKFWPGGRQSARRATVHAPPVLLRPVTWEAILGMDFLKKYKASIDFTSGQITFDNLCQPNLISCCLYNTAIIGHSP